MDAIAVELNLPASQCLALFVKAIAKFTNEITKIYTADIEKDMQVQEKQMNPLKDQTK